MISRIFFADELACISPEHCIEVCGSAAGCSNVAYPRLVMSVMPVGLRGLMMAVMIAALMSDLDSIFNSSSTIFTLDIYKMLRKQTTPRELLIVGRLFVVFTVAVSIAWVPVIIEMQGGQMFYYIQEVIDYLTPPIAALFLLSVLWKRCNETGAFWGGVAGFIVGVVRLILALIYREPHCDQPDERPSFIKDVHFMYIAAILFWVSAIVTIIVSLCTPPPKEEQILTTTLWGLRQRKKKKEKAGEEMKSLNHAALNGNTKDHLNKLNGDHVVQNGHQPLMSEPSLAERGEGAGVRDVEEEGCFGGGGVESCKCVKFLECLCGFKENPAKVQVLTVQEHEKMVDKLLHEPPRTKIVLNVGLVLICSIGVFIFIYFSV